MDIYIIELPKKIYPPRDIFITDCSIKIKDILFATTIDEDVEVDYKYHKEIYGFELCKNEILDYITHRQVWQQFLSTQEEYAFVVESNVRLNFTSEQYTDIINSFDKDIDMYFPYDTFEYMKSKPALGGTLLNPNIREQTWRENYAINCKWGNSIYIISRSGAKKLLKSNLIKDRLDNEIVMMSLKEELNVYYNNIECFNYNDIDWREWPDRIDIMLEAIKETTSWNNERKQRIKELLAILSMQCRKLGIKPLLQGGSHLGYIQYGGIIPWDDDVDIGIEKTQLEILEKSLLKCKDIYFKEYIEPITNVPYYKIWDITGEKIDGHEHTFPFVDIWLYEVKYPNLVFANGIICPNSARKDFIKVNFEGSDYYVPYNSLEVLDSRYSMWRDYIVVYRYCHRLEKAGFYPLLIPIKSDSNGRFKEIRYK